MTEHAMPTTPDQSKENTRMPAPPNGDAPAADAASVVAEFLTAYFSGDLNRAQSLVSDDFVFQAPLVEQHATKEVFFGGAEQKIALVRGIRILRSWVDGEEVSTVYEIDVRTEAGAASMRMHEWHTVRDGLLVSTVMTFDSSARAALLMHQALMSPHP
jgi:ketosteroid isomerase-like protein